MIGSNPLAGTAFCNPFTACRGVLKILRHLGRDPGLQPQLYFAAFFVRQQTSNPGAPRPRAGIASKSILLDSNSTL
ncbi:hypothetical protein Poly21_14320 [Allorhodopirellula heiligendammensis]|uniref:Uncharacterized protein n=1 Tax=Allorhodopirellula heiligendammensis TaxID=2714739 RepID=A0A5C6C3V1_9BACT|nr:hypothetical protein Poly21_14320 [Allorhodopirellula heiligendammensis]